MLRDVPYKTYVALRRAPGNAHLRMTYHDGTLEIMSPGYVHELGASRLGLFLRALALALELDYLGTRCSTFRKAGQGSRKGKGKEPDESFYFRSERLVRDNEQIDLDAGDPPPDLWIEVDNRASSEGRMPVYAAFGVPEVWRYRPRKKTLVFLGRNEDGTYGPIERSLSLPILTPSLVLGALALGEGLSDMEWHKRLNTWISDLVGRPTLE